MKLKFSSGITIIELLLVIALIGLLTAVVAPIGGGFLARATLRTKSDELLLTLKTAQLNSLLGKQGSLWGVKVDSNTMTLFAGNSYSQRNSAHDEVTTISSPVTISAFELIFSNQGDPSVTPTITINGGASTVVRTLTINQYGAISIN